MTDLQAFVRSTIDLQTLKRLLREFNAAVIKVCLLFTFSLKRVMAGYRSMSLLVTINHMKTARSLYKFHQKVREWVKYISCMSCKTQRTHLYFAK